jgi:hypothetical protein
MAILNISSYITNASLSSVTSAGQISPYFAIKYFLPFYDPRIDSSISVSSGTTNALNISSLNLTSATNSTLYGEKIYASMLSAYNLTNRVFLYNPNNQAIIDGQSATIATKQDVPTKVNTLNGMPLTACVSASTISATSTPGNFTITNAYNVSGSRINTTNPLSGSSLPTSAFFRVQSYSPKIIGQTSASGQYKCRIPYSDGSFKFNGLALYVSKVDQYNYDTPNTNPILFAVILFDQAQEKSKLTGGMNSYEFDIDLGFDWHTVGTSGNTPVYVETGYWTKVPTVSNTSAYALNYSVLSKKH